MATIFDIEERKYNQIDIDVRDSRIRDLERELAKVKAELYKYKTHVKMVANSSWGSTVYTAADDWIDIMMKSNRYEN